MTDEEKKAIERLDKRLTIEKYTKNIGTPVYIDDLKTALNLIQKQQEELTRTKTDLQNSWHNNLELAEKCLKQDNIINEMIEEYEFVHRANIINFCEDNLRDNTCIQDCKSCIKQYFEKKVGESSK